MFLKNCAWFIGHYLCCCCIGTVKEGNRRKISNGSYVSLPTNLDQHFSFESQELKFSSAVNMILDGKFGHSILDAEPSPNNKTPKSSNENAAFLNPNSLGCGPSRLRAAKSISEIVSTQSSSSSSSGQETSSLEDSSQIDGSNAQGGTPSLTLSVFNSSVHFCVVENAQPKTKENLHLTKTEEDKHCRKEYKRPKKRVSKFLSSWSQTLKNKGRAAKQKSLPPLTVEEDTQERPHQRSRSAEVASKSTRKFGFYDTQTISKALKLQQLQEKAQSSHQSGENHTKCLSGSFHTIV